MALAPPDRWKPENRAEAEQDLRDLGPDAYRPKGWLVERLGGSRMRAERVQAIRGVAPRAAAAAPPPSDDDLVVSRWDRPDAGRFGSRETPRPRETFSRVGIPEDDTAEEPIEDVIARAEAQFRREKARAATLGPRQLRMPEGPYAIAHLGDPHLDDPGCDWPELRRTVRTIASTPGMYAGNGGDSVNNWVGPRLLELYAEQETTREQGWRLTRWLLGAVRWAYVLAGNHDKFAQGMRTLRHVAESTNATIGVLAPDDIRLELVSPNGVAVRIHARHDHPGGSQWNPLHALRRAVAFGDWPADIYCAFHRHEAASGQGEYSGRMRTMLRARGFKRFDDYAREKGFVEQEHGTSITTIVDPSAGPADRVRVRWDIEEAAEELTWLRRRRAA